MSRRAWQPTDDQRNTVKAMSAAGIREDHIADCMSIAPKTLRKHCRVELDQATDQTTAVAVAQLFKAVKAGESWAICFWLKCRARWRETERVEHVGMDGGPVEIRVTYEDLPAKTPSPALTASGSPGGPEAL